MKPPPLGLPRVFVATMAVVLVPFAALFVIWLGAAMAQSTHHHPFHYDFYRHWKQPGSTASCCDARITRDGKEEGDCEPTQADLRPGKDGVVRWHAWLRQEGRWVEVPDGRILRERNPNTFDGHLCWNYGQVLCFVPPDTGG